MRINISEYFQTKQVRQLIFSMKQRFSKRKSPILRVPRGHFVIYVGDDEKERKRFVIPISYLKNPLFQELLRNAAEELGYDHGMEGLIVPCNEYHFHNVVSRLNYA